MEKRTQRIYTPGQRKKAVAFANEITAKEAAPQLGIPEDTCTGKKGLLQRSSKTELSNDDEVEHFLAEKCLRREIKAEKTKNQQLEKENPR